MTLNTHSKFPVLAALLKTTPRARVLARQLGVEKLFEFAMTRNKSANGPYHNAEHGFEVARLAYGLASMVKHDFAERKALFVAGLFHDFNHSLGALPDSENISIAQQGLATALVHHKQELPSRLQRFIAFESIAATQYPYVPLNFAFKELCALLRDADRLQILTLKWRSQIKGLGKEMGVYDQELLQRSRLFHDNLLETLESPAAQALRPELKVLFEVRHQILSCQLTAQTPG